MSLLNRGFETVGGSAGEAADWTWDFTASAQTLASFVGANTVESFETGWLSNEDGLFVFDVGDTDSAVFTTLNVDPKSLDGGWWSSPTALGGEALPTVFRKVLAAAGL